MVYKYPISDTEKEQLAQSMGFGSWDEYINLDTERVPEPRPVLNSVDYSKVPDLNLSEEERDRLSNISIRGRASALAQGKRVWSLEEIADIHTFREESFNHSSKYRPNSPNWNYTTSKMNEKYGENWSTGQVRCAYHYNKDKLPDEEE